MTGLDSATVLVTGADGFIGRHLTRRLEDLGADVRRTTRVASVLEDRANWAGDLRDAEFCAKVIRSTRPELVFHAAGTIGRDEGAVALQRHLEGNVVTTSNLLDAIAAGHPTARALIVSSAAIYGPAKSPIHESAPFDPRSAYGLSKATQELLAIQTGQTRDLDIVRIRPFNLLGPGQSPHLLVPSLCLQVARSERSGDGTLLVGNLLPRRDFLDVRDAVDAMVLLGRAAASGSVFNLGSGVPHSVADVVDLILNMSSHALKVKVDDHRVRRAEVDDSFADTNKLCSATGWAPTITLAESLRVALDDARRLVDEGER